MTRQKKLALNSITSLIYQVTALVCGFVLPRFLLAAYGDGVYGLTSSITQFLGFISLCEMGVGAVVQSALYKPLADGDDAETSRIVKSSDRFFKRIAYILVAYTVILMFVYPLLTRDFDYTYTLLLILVMSVSTFAQYYFGMTYRLLLTADQLGFIYYVLHSVSLVLNTAACVVMIRFGASIHAVKLATSLIFLLQPICLSIIARRKYKIDRKIALVGEPIKQKWNGITQHIAAVVLGNTGVMVLTILSTLENVAIYSVYFLVVNGVRQIIMSLTGGTQAMFGNMLAKGETETLDRSYSIFEWVMHTLVTVVFGATAALIMPFVSVYTNGVTDVNYAVPLFAVLITLAYAVYCIRVPYNTIVLAAGHYKQTQLSAIIEAAINIVVSVATVWRFGLVGVAIGTLCAMLYRTVYFAFYLQRNIINRKIGHFVKHILTDALVVILFALCLYFFNGAYQLKELTYTAWIVLALKVVGTMALPAILVNLVLHRRTMAEVLGALLKKKRRRA